MARTDPPPGQEPGGASGRFPALRHRNYRLFFVGQLVSVTGTWMQTLAQSWLVLELSGSNSAWNLGLVNLCQFLPILLLGLFAGVVADRVPKRNLLVVTQCVAMTLAATLAVLVATDAVRLWHVYALALGLGVSNAFDMPTRQAFVSEMVDRASVMNAVALNSALFNAGRIVGPAIAGLLLALFGPAVCFALNALSFLAAIGALLRMRLEPRAVGGGGAALGRLREGLAYVRDTTRVRLAIVLIGFVATFGMNFQVWVPLLAREDFDLGAGGFGLLMAANGLGSLAGALTLAVTGRAPRPALMFGAALALGLAELGLAAAGAVPLPVAVAALLLVATGFAMSTAMALANTVVQTTAPDELRGRVMSVYMTVFAGTAPFGALLAGAAAGAAGTPASIALGGAVTAAAAVGVGLLAARTGTLRPVRVGPAHQEWAAPPATPAQDGPRETRRPRPAPAESALED